MCGEPSGDSDAKSRDPQTRIGTRTGGVSSALLRCVLAYNLRHPMIEVDHNVGSGVEYLQSSENRNGVAWKCPTGPRGRLVI